MIVRPANAPASEAEREHGQTRDMMQLSSRRTIDRGSEGAGHNHLFDALLDSRTENIRSSAHSHLRRAQPVSTSQSFNLSVNHTPQQAVQVSLRGLAREMQRVR